jgi:hypothetical protein
MDFYTEVAKLVNKDLGTDGQETAIVLQEGLSQNMIREKLVMVISYMLENQFEKLCNAMYRLDVSERKFQEVLYSGEPAEIPGKLADLVIEREILKVKTRMLYKDGML